MRRKRGPKDGSVKNVFIEQVYQGQHFETGLVLGDLEQPAPQLDVFSLGYLGHKTNQPEARFGPQ
jgi:hypothetical protein